MEGGLGVKVRIADSGERVEPGLGPESRFGDQDNFDREAPERRAATAQRVEERSCHQTIRRLNSNRLRIRLRRPPLTPRP